MIYQNKINVYTEIPVRPSSEREGKYKCMFIERNERTQKGFYDKIELS